ncbi:glycerol-1-phosphatase [Cryptococcus neoformans C23]|uniref:Glycerol-1-phosphatase n=2 Tax=Cryptococcus neoformans TaxID=5207 RepID=A0A854Q8U7_CRYNE|nr:glycerol-1-phosphatase [Cryptococcus neoformans var. grubii H99]AUB28493.1 glycerol-1-phosphatase [Cryptococcus neoformans var. grubii]OWZ27165.1 glycerol-1-phosphatase [Cryptococcus neoformans var. grubii AD2-60a]OWZ29063.1 glycerol-1-phosphatase [Cryptococcus neoformans var. grubii AD1-83a]OWZ39127.1 glycerol-1-phosphatase [Cryptococcus neoformans var. grubii C23]OWZ50458.1 glycerol-1-phosphatase [Cryptococcus neoformans var. grubii 125.91]OXC81528.1 glycerol-1-phosphatase [Cryptococcus |eukprot:XP_012053015.1 glycerol-1-phosphatase [Cryptococcus neoformans var. grubii H99]
MSPTTIKARGILFDLDGTLISSTTICESVWHKWAEVYPVDLTEVFESSHGIRTRELLRHWLNITDPVELETATEKFETDVLKEAQRLASTGKGGITLLPGVKKLLLALDTASKDAARWAIVTSATNAYATNAITTLSLPRTSHLITADEVSQGKPHPEPYIMGAAALGLKPTECIVFEDAPSGVKAGVASGARVVAVCTSHKRAALEGLGAHLIVDDLSDIDLDTEGDEVTIIFPN